MYWLMICRHRQNIEKLRDLYRAAHRKHVSSGADDVTVLLGSALTLDDASTSLGNFGILEAPTREAAEAFAEADPFARAGVVDSIEIIALSARFSAQKVALAP